MSTDDSEIFDEALSLGAEALRRPDALATASASSEAALLHALDELTDSPHDLPSVVALVQCTSPFTTAEDIDSTIELVARGQVDSAFTAAPSHAFLWIGPPDRASALNHDTATRPMRQDLEPQYAETGGVYAMKTVGLQETQHRFFGRIGFHEVDGSRALEIDDLHDLDRARALAPHADRADRLERVPSNAEALVLDFDGVLTDDRVVTDQNGTESVVCHRGDGMGIELLRSAGIPTFVLSRERNAVVAARCEKLGVGFEQAIDDKATAFAGLIERQGIDPDQVVFVGNDTNDLACIEMAGCGVAVSDAHPSIRAAADILLSKRGGRGAVREICDLILQRLHPD